jgi:hypothetical protein
MRSIEIIDKRNSNKLDQLGPTLAETYKIAFAGEPWYEVSRCGNDNCEELFAAQIPGCLCQKCGLELTAAYSADELVESWQAMVMDEEATIEITKNEDGIPILATIARPTTPNELFQRKYKEVEPMQTWLAENLPQELVWIEDTFANREISPVGNLVGRGATLGRIATYYSGLMIATRTLTPAVIAATLRDAGKVTDISIGSEQVGRNIAVQARRTDVVPDRRTVLRIGIAGLVV